MACSELTGCAAKTTGCSRDPAELVEQLLWERTVVRLEQEGGETEKGWGQSNEQAEGEVQVTAS